MPKFSIARSIQINAPVELVFDRVCDFSSWTKWSPWLCAEPDAKVTVTGEGPNVGDVYRWDGEVTGSGEVEHKKLHRPNSIEDEIRFLKPMKSTSEVGFDLVSKSEGTQITWKMNGGLPFFLFFMVPKIEQFVAMDFDRGLKMLKEWIETGEIASKTESKGKQAIGPFRVVGVSGRNTISEIGPAMDQLFIKVDELFVKSGLEPTGERLAIYHRMDTKTQTLDYTAGRMVDLSVNPPASLVSYDLPQVSALRTDHLGSYDYLGNAWSAAHQIARYKKMKVSRKIHPFELYKNAPQSTDRASLITEVYLPLR